jgi:hypothetical protein
MKTTVLFLFFSGIVFSQQLAVSKIDEFTKKEVIQVNASKGAHWKTTDNIAKGFFNNIFLSLNKSHTTNFLTLDINIGTAICVSNNDGKIITLLEDDSTLELLQVSKIDCNSRVAVRYFLSDLDLEKLKTTVIKKIRLYTTEGFFDFEIKENKKEIIKKTFILFQKNSLQALK